MNHYIKYLGKEDILQHQVYNYFLYTYRNKALFFHVPNEGRRTPFERFKAKYLGMIPGIPDIIMVKDQDVLFLELKVKPNKPTKSQEEFLNKARSYHYGSHVAYTFDEAKKIIDNFMEE